jgi:hypothetical protein
MLSRLLDFLIECLKWPVALLATLSLPALIEALDRFHLGNLRFFVFIGGVVVYFAMKAVAAARSNLSMQILAHEFTHAFFALLTFHRVTHIHLNMDESGGAMRFRGKGNWLITIGPYFFPLFLFFLMLGVTFFSDRLPKGYVLNFIFGYFFAYHVESVLMQIHGEQPDFKLVGFPFCWLFLPGANIFVCSCVMAFNMAGWVGISRYAEFIYRLDLHNIKVLISFLTTQYSTFLS